MTEQELQQYTLSRELLDLARQLNLRASRHSTKAQIRELLLRIRFVCEEMEDELQRT